MQDLNSDTLYTKLKIKVVCTKIVTNNNSKIFAWHKNPPFMNSRKLDAIIDEIHFSNGVVFKYSHQDNLSSELSWFLLKQDFIPFGCKFKGSAIVELKSFPCNGIKLLNYIEFLDINTICDILRKEDRWSYQAVKRNVEDYGVIPEITYIIRQFNSLCDIILFGELVPSEFNNLYTRKDDLIFVKYADCKRRSVYYTYKYKITNLKKFLALITKIHIQYNEYFNIYD